VIRLEIKEEKKSDEYYYCGKCKKEFVFDDCKLDGAPISGTYFISPCCGRDINWEEDIEKREKNVVIKKWVAIDDLISQLEDWNNIFGLNTFEIICKIKELNSLSNDNQNEEVKNG